MKHRPLCRHCQKRPSHRSRGLCYRCYTTPEIQRLYPAQKRPKGYGLKTPQRLPTPTLAIPGSSEKIRILAERAGKGQDLWHPEDLDIRGMED